LFCLGSFTRALATGAAGNVQLEAHHGLVNTADLFYVKIPVAEALSVEDE